MVVMMSAAAAAKARGSRKAVQRLGMESAVVAVESRQRRRGRALAGEQKPKGLGTYEFVDFLKVAM